MPFAHHLHPPMEFLFMKSMAEFDFLYVGI